MCVCTSRRDPFSKYIDVAMATIPDVDELLAAPTSPLKPYKKIVLFGDSQFERSFNPDLDFSFSSAISHFYARRADLLNRGIYDFV